MTRRIWAVLGSALMVALALTGCTDTNPLGSDLSVRQEGALSYSRSFSTDYAQIMRGETPDFSARDNQAVIGPNGGYLYVSGYMLTVPQGAVEQPTLFTMKLTEDGSIGVDLNATRVGSKDTNDVGRAGFKVPLRLMFTYAYSSDVPNDPSHIRIAWRKPGGGYDVMPSAVDTRYKVIYGLVKHFSEYILIQI